MRPREYLRPRMFDLATAYRLAEVMSGPADYEKPEEEEVTNPEQLIAAMELAQLLAATKPMEDMDHE